MSPAPPSSSHPQQPPIGAAPDHARVVRNDEAGRYELQVGQDTLAVAVFREQGDVTTVPHTEVLPDRRGEGLGALLVAGVLDDLRDRNQRVDAQCWYVAQFIDEQPAYRDLLVGS